MADLRPLLQRIPLFAELPQADTQALVDVASLYTCEPGHAVVELGAAVDALYGICTGRFKVVVPHPDGRDTTLGLLWSGDIFGEVALLSPRGRSARVVALEDGVLLRFGKDPFLRLLPHSPTLNQRLLTLLAERLRMMTAHHQEVLFLPVEHRVRTQVQRLAQRFGHPHPAGTLIGLKLSQGELADLVGATRQSVNKALRQMELAGELLQHDGHWVIPKAS